MTESEYLSKVLEEQALSPEEERDLQVHRRDVEKLLRESFGSSPTIRFGGSHAKGTMNRESYDLDLLCYFPRYGADAGETLEEIYETVQDTLSEVYHVEPKASALRLLSPDGKADFHIDVVPGRYVDGESGDVFLHRQGESKERLKTNIDVHVSHVRNSGVIPAIRLMKLWSVRKHIGIKTFVLELMVIALLKSERTRILAEQLKHVMLQFRDHSDSLSAVDPANPQGNDLSEALDGVRLALAPMARETLDAVDRFGWQGIFGSVNVETDSWKSVAIREMADAALVRPKPYFGG